MKKLRKKRRRKEEQFPQRGILKVRCFLFCFVLFHCYNVRMAKVHFPPNTAKSWEERCPTGRGTGHRLLGIQRLKETLIPKLVFCISLFIKLHKAIAALSPRSLYCLKQVFQKSCQTWSHWQMESPAIPICYFQYLIFHTINSLHLISHLNFYSNINYTKSFPLWIQRASKGCR